MSTALTWIALAAFGPALFARDAALASLLGFNALVWSSAALVLRMAGG